MNTKLVLVITILLGFTAAAWSQNPYGNESPGGATSPREAMGFAYPHDQPWYGTRRYSGIYQDEVPQDLYSRKVEHGAYTSSNSQYGFPLGIGLTAGFADVAATPTGQGFPAGFNSPWYQYPYYWNSSTSGPVNTYMPYPGMNAWNGYRPPYVNPWAPPLYGPQPYGGPAYGGGYPGYGGGYPGGYGGGANPGYGGSPYQRGGGGFPGWNSQVPQQTEPTFW